MHQFRHFLCIYSIKTTKSHLIQGSRVLEIALSTHSFIPRESLAFLIYLKGQLILKNYAKGKHNPFQKPNKLTSIKWGSSRKISQMVQSLKRICGAIWCWFRLPMNSNGQFSKKNVCKWHYVFCTHFKQMIYFKNSILVLSKNWVVPISHIWIWPIWPILVDWFSTW